jgi:hypothetical protein
VKNSTFGHIAQTCGIAAGLSKNQSLVSKSRIDFIKD